MFFTHCVRILTAVVVLTATASALAQNGNKPYEQFQDMVYGDVHGTGLMMDVFVPTGEKNGLAIVDIASGAFHSDRGKIRDHESARFYHIFTTHGYTIFAIRPGSVSKYTAEEMVAHIKQGIRWVKAHADEYGIDPERIGLVGASAGGHLATLTSVQPEPGRPDAKDALEQHSTDVAAVGVFFPPTNFLKWGDEARDLNRIATLMFSDGIEHRDEEEVRKKAEQISPVLQIKEKTPPFIIFHGDADPIVPLQQSEILVQRLEEVGTDVEFYVKEGGAHPWMTIPVEVEKMAQWFDRKLQNPMAAAEDNEDS